LDIVHRLNYKKDVSVAGCASIFRKRSTLLGGLPRSIYSQALGNIATVSLFIYTPEKCKVYGVTGLDVFSGAYLNKSSVAMMPSYWEQLDVGSPPG